MHQNISLLKKALTELNLASVGIEGFPDALIVQGLVFIRATTPFNSEAVSLLCRDKAAVHTLLLGKVPMPKTNIVYDSVKPSLSFLYPCIVKMNKGERGIQVFLVSNETEKDIALSQIFTKESRQYDYIALVQEYLKPAAELRAVVSGGRVVHVYNRETLDTVSGKTSDFVELYSQTIIKTLGLSWGALDFIQVPSGDVFFLEANTKPSFEKMGSVEDGRIVIDAYKKSLKLFIQP